MIPFVLVVARVRDAGSHLRVGRAVRSSPRVASRGVASRRRIESGTRERTNERTIDRSTSGRGRCVSLDDGDDDGKIGAAAAVGKAGNAA
jgi:hypothetical protein|tara:strand:- start:1246 stop:1515 length:270 start_codon:yes stop_codon:yes gene_type:complete